jgi:hypothetical protein
MSTGKNFKRRDFIKGISLTGFSLVPGSQVLAGLFGNAAFVDTSRFVDYSVRMTHYESLLTLEFYFINIAGSLDVPLKSITAKKFDSNDLWAGQRESYMIVRLPQQHIAEQPFYLGTHPNESERGMKVIDPNVDKGVYAHTLISGYSYLVFRIRFDKLPDISNGMLSLNAKELMNWNADHFKLVVRRDRNGTIFQVNNQTGRGTPEEDYKLEYPLGYKGKTFNPENFPRIKSRSIQDGTDQKGNSREFGDSSPVTALEIPRGLILCPSLPDQDNFKFRWTFSYPAPEIGSGWTSRMEELWMATLKVERKQLLPGAPEPIRPAQLPESANENPQVAAEFEHKGDDLMRLLPLGSFPVPIREGSKPDEPKIILPGTSKETEWNIIPKPLHRAILVKLYMEYFLKASARKLSFTPLGVCTEIKWRNSSVETNKFNELFAWKQSISFGRDQEIKVAELVVEACFGMKMLLIETNKRRSIKSVALLERFFLLMPLDVEKDYTLYNNDENINNYDVANYKCNTPYKKVMFATLDPKRVVAPEWQDKNDTAQDAEGKVVAFWAKQPGFNKEEPYIEWDFEAIDWHNQKCSFKKKLFLLRGSLTEKTGDGKNTKYPFEADKAVEEKRELLARQLDEKTPFDINVIDNTIKDLKQLFSNPGNIWHRIEKVSEQSSLQYVEYYRQFLERLLQKTEADIRARAGEIEDEVIEEFTIFKKRLLDIQNIIWENIGSAQQQVEAILHDVEQLGHTIPAATKQKLDELAEKILAELSLKENWDKVPDLIKDYEKQAQEFINRARDNATAEINVKIEALRQMVNAAVVYPVATYFDHESQRFLQQIPAQMRTDIARTIKTSTDKINECLNEIRKIERTAKSKIDLFKKDIGYAVYGVEEELENLKARLIQDFPKEWKEKYERLRQGYHKANAKISNLKTDFIIFRNNLRKRAEDKLFDFYEEYACFPQLHTAQVYVQTVTDLVQRDIPIKMKYAADYYKNQVDEFALETKKNVAKVFSEIKADARELVKTSVREIANELGGLVNPELAADFMTYVKDTRDAATQILDEAKAARKEIEAGLASELEKIKKEFEENETFKELKAANADMSKQLEAYENDIRQAHQSLVLLGRNAKESFEQHKKMAEMEAKNYFKGLEAKILGSINLKDILGVGFEPPKFDRKNNEISYRFVTQKLQTVSLGPFKFYNNVRGNKAQLTAYFRKPIRQSGEFYSSTSLTNFSVGIFEDRLLIEFKKLEIRTDNNVKNKVSVDIGDVRFQKELAFLQALSRNIQIPGTGITLSITPREISADFAYALPSINGGAFTMANLKFRVGVAIPITIGGNKSATPIVARFGINGPDDKFVVAAGIWGGRGHFVIEATPKYIRRIDTGIDFGGYFALDLVIAKGEAFLMAGIRYVYMRDEVGDTSMEFYCMLSCGGSVTVFGFITISILFVLCLRYQKYQGKSSLYGIASVSCSVKIGFFKKSFTLSYSKRLAGTESARKEPPTARIFRPEQYQVTQAVTVDTGAPLSARFADYDFRDRPATKYTLRDTYQGGLWKKYCKSYRLNRPFSNYSLNG